MSARLVCLLGAECTGKTTLARALAQHFGGVWVPEYLRSFCDAQGRTPTCAEQIEILQTQVAHETLALAQANRAGQAWVFGDTAPLLTAVYSEQVFGDRSLYPQAHALHARYALSLLLAPDIAWQADGLQRDGDHVRAPVQACLERQLAWLGAPTARVSGQGGARLESALAALAAICGSA